MHIAALCALGVKLKLQAGDSFAHITTPGQVPKRSPTAGAEHADCSHREADGGSAGEGGRCCREEGFNGRRRADSGGV